MNENLEPYVYKELSIKSVEADEEAQIRVYYDIADLVESIREIGQLAPGFAYKSGDKYKVFVGIRRLLAVKELYEKEGKPDEFKAFVFEKKPTNYYELIREENAKRADLSGLDKVHIIIKFPFADKILPFYDVRFITPIKKNLEQKENVKDIQELAEEERRAKAKGHENHLSIPEILFLFRDLHSLEERKLFAFFFLIHRLPVKYIETVNFKQYAIANAPKLSGEELEIAGLSKEDVEKITAIYKAPPYHAEIIQEAFEEKEEEPKEAFVRETEERPAEEQPSFVNEQPLEVEKSEEQHEEKVEKLESEEANPEINEEERIVIMDHDVEYENINGQKVMLIKKESGIQAVYVEDGQELEVQGVKARIKYV
jgi:hypothetical protein